MQQYPPSDNFYAYSPCKKKELRNEDKVNKIDVFVLYSNIYNALGKKGEDKL